MHLALQNADGSYTPYNENYGIFFARSPKAQNLNENLDGNDYRSLKDPSLLRMADGTYGVISVRTNRGTATGDSTAKSSVLIATSEDLLTYSEQENSGSIVDLGETNGVNAPYAVYDTASKQYVVGWADDNGVAKYTTFDSLKGSASKHGSVLYGSIAKSGVLDADGVQGIANFRSGATIAVDEATVKALNTRYGRSENTGTSNLTDITVEKGSSIDEMTSQLPKNVDLTYSDGSTGSLPISSWNTEGIDLTKVGDYTVTGTVKQTEYQIPFAEDRADPSVYKWQWTHEVDGKEVTETKFLMIASNDIQGDVTWQHGSPHMPFRMADTISGLADEPGNPNALIQSNGYNNKEVSLLKAGDKDSEGNAIMHSFWAPEIHEIDGRLTILFMAGYGNTWSNGKSVYMQLKQDADGHDLDPTDPDNWTVPTPIYRNDASLLNGNKQLAATASGGVGMSLDMTYFQDADGRSYYAWQQLGATYIATMDPKDPAHVTSSPVRIVTPEYAWNAAIAEGPNVTMRDGKLYLMFSGSGVGKTYTTGLAVADAAGSDLTDPASWTALNYPIQKSGPFNGEMQLGTGHGMWSEDEDGNQIYVFHAYATKNLGSVNATGRDMFVRRVHWAADGMPVFDMSSSEELANKIVSVTVHVVDDAVAVDKSGLSKALASAKQLHGSDYTAASWKAFATMLTSAEKVYADDTATQKDVDDTTVALVKAQAALVKIDGSDSGDGSGDSTKPSDGSSVDAGDKTGNNLGLFKTGAAVLSLSGVAVALAVAGIALTLQRKRRA
ncbi:family 43 glycosylhydrolase [Bifidobacterium longum]|uniref:family 43 glycosylhydrolase n=1 Tax=Bifidobacterium longum TaxID=216816 RepID=UPI000B0F1C59|nr:family 43 glycosylhydrolase [Bifidobacterium longum]